MEQLIRRAVPLMLALCSVEVFAQQQTTSGKSAEAEQLFRRSLAILEKARGPDHPSTQLVRENFRLFLAEQGGIC